MLHPLRMGRRVGLVDGYQPSARAGAESPRRLVGREALNRLEDFDEGGVHFAPVNAVGRNDAGVIAVLAVDLLLNDAHCEISPVVFQEFELLH